MNSIKRSALIAGSSGLIGAELLQLLLNDGVYSKVYSLVRKNTGIRHPKLEEILVNFDALDASLGSIKADDVFCCLGTTMKKAGSEAAFRKVDYDYPLALAHWAKVSGSNGFYLVSAMGASDKSSIFYNKVKGELERDITSLGISSTAFFRPSLLLGNRIENRPGEKAAIIFAKAVGFLFVGPLKNYKAIHVTKVAKAMIESAKSPLNGIRIVLSGEMQ